MTGKATDDLTLVGGLTLLDADLEGGSNDGREPINVANVLAKLYAEYAVPPVAGLVLTGGAYYTGPQWADEANTDRLDAYTTFDAGLRYTPPAWDDQVTFRVNVTNLADEAYWRNGYYLGDPRTVAFSVQKLF